MSGCCSLLGWTGITGPHSSPKLPHVSSKSYTPGPCRSRHAKPCGGRCCYGIVGRRFHQIGLTAMDGVCFRASSTYPGRRSSTALASHPPRDHAHPNNHQAWASCMWAEETPAVQRPLHLDQLRVVERYKSTAGHKGALVIHCTQPLLRPSRLCLATGTRGGRARE